MNNVSINNGTLIVEPLGLDKLWSFKRKLEFPIAHICGATFDPGASNEPKGIRHPGLAIPGKWVGTFTKDNETSFWNVLGQNRTVVIQLRDEKFERLYLTVSDPRSVVDAVNRATSQAR